MNLIPSIPSRQVKRRFKTLTRNGGVRVAAGVCVLSLVGMSVAAGTQSTPADEGDQASAKIQNVADTTTDSDHMTVDVAKVVAITSKPDGTPTGQGLYTQTQATGNGTSTVTVPVGTSRPTNLTSFSRLNTEADSIIYSIESSGTEVTQLGASGGKYAGNMPVGVDVDLKVNGEEVDPNTATSFSGNVELTYNFINNTNTRQPITYTDATGNVITEEKNIAIPFAVVFDATFDKGWSQIDAPWADSGFSAGLTLTGTATMKPSILNDYNPNSSLTVKAFTENASLPSSAVKIQPQSSSGASSLSSKVAQAGGEVDDALNKAIPLLAGVESAMGKASGDIAKILDSKVNPILNLLSQLKVNPDKAEAALVAGAADLESGANSFLGINSAIYKYTAEAAQGLANATGPKNQATVAAAIKEINAAAGAIAFASKELPKVTAALTGVATYLGTSVGTTLGPVICPGGATNCTWGEALQGISTDQLVSTCTTGNNTNTVVTANSGQILTTLNAVIAANPTKSWTPNLQTLTNLVTAQSTTAYPANCVATSTAVASQVSGLFSNLGELSNALNDLTPLLATLTTDLQQVSAGLTRLLADMPVVHSNMTQAANLLGPVAAANDRAEVLLDRAILTAIDELKPLIDRLAQTANLIGAAALPLESRLNGLPGLIDALAYGTVGSFVGDAQNIAELSAKLTGSANEAVAVSKAVDAKFNTGEAFPYGVATGDHTSTNAMYSFEIESAVAAQNNRAATAGYALVLLILGAVAAVWLTRKYS